MNCQAGDLARVVAPGYFLGCSCGGRTLAVVPDTLVICEQPAVDGWVLRDPVHVDVVLACCGGHVRGRFISLPDGWLRPIRDPGPDAIDETLEWLPVPHKEHA